MDYPSGHEDPRVRDMDAYIASHPAASMSHIHQGIITSVVLLVLSGLVGLFGYVLGRCL